MRVNIDGSEVVWQSLPRAHGSISRYVLDAGYSELMDTYSASKMAELPKTLERRDTGEPTCTYSDHSD